MGRDFALRPASRRRENQIHERFMTRDTSQTPRPPLSQVILNSAFARFSEEPPWFPTRLRHNCHITEFFVSVLRPVASSKSMDYANDFPSFFESNRQERLINEMRNQWVCCYKNVSTRNECRK